MVDRALQVPVVNGKGAAPEKTSLGCPAIRRVRMTGDDVQPYSMPGTVRVLIAYDDQLGDARRKGPASATTRTLPHQ